MLRMKDSTRNALTLTALVLTGLSLPAGAKDTPARGGTPDGKPGDAAGPVKIYLLSGQSNMTGRGYPGDFSTPAVDQNPQLVHYIMKPENVEKYKCLFSGPNKDETGWTIRDDVFITYGEWPHPKHGEEEHSPYKRHGGLGMYYGGRGSRGFGPELGIGHVLGDFCDETVLLVKVSFGGNSLAVHFRPPSSGGTVGDKYPLLIKAVREAIEHLPQIVPGYDEEQGYELVGFFWNQGLSDIVEPHASEYGTNLVNLINDLRKDLNVPRMKTVVAVSGNWGWDLAELKQREMSEDKRTALFAAIRKVTEAQLAVSKRPEFKGTVATAETRDFWRPREQFGGHGTDTHWNANAESYWLIGEAMGREMVKLLKADAADTKPETGTETHRKACFDPVVKDIEGWTVHVDPQMLEGEHAEAGGRSLTMLANHLQRIDVLMSEERLEEVQKLEIWLERDHPEIGSMQYHPSVGWLTARGYDARLAKKVHIPRAASLLSRHQMIKHPAVVLHELAHAYHDQVLGFEEPRIKAAYDKAMKAGLYDEVLLYTGRKVRHYAATNHKEYFAEGTEAYFYRNDFYPFVRAELKEHDPVLHDLLEEIWGPIK